MSGLRTRRLGDLVWSEASGEGWRAVFSTRHGGVSEGDFATLNVSFSVGDDPRRVVENRRRLGVAAGFDPLSVIVGGQVHGTAVREVGWKDRGRGAAGPADTLPDTDGLTTSDPAVPLMVTVADCVPVVLAGTRRRHRRVTVVHAGWRGMIGGIVEAAARMHTPDGQTVAVVGPSIGPCCFTVGDDVGAAFAARFPESLRDGRVDLWAVAAHQLAAAGVPAERVVVAGVCTVCDRTFFSHRRDGGRTGRQAAVAWLEEDARDNGRKESHQHEAVGR